ncbi:MAG: AAA family ATPase [Rhabdochlamydiaceae bacterium]|jgi:predicted AAA+ superfamily ATPase
MHRFILETYNRLIEEISLAKTRYLYSSFHTRNRLTGLIGARGVGKTTLMLQYIKNELYKQGKCFYFSADHIYFMGTTLLELVSNLYQHEGYQIIFIDEIHKYQNWNQELKNLYDAFPSLKIVFSSSSMLDLVKESYDLSRQTILFHLHGLSFREYLNFACDFDLKAISLETLLKEPPQIDVPRLFSHFQDYLKHGYYPFVLEDVHSYYEKLTRVIDKTIYEDIANYYNLKTPSLHYFKKILTYLASIPPGELVIHNLAQNLGVDDKTAQHYLTILASVGLIREIYPIGSGGQRLRKPSKIFLNNTTIMHTLQQYLEQPISKGTERELFFIQSLQDAGVELFYSSEGDFQTMQVVFEIGGKNKTRRQIKEVKKPSYLVKDDILTPLKGEIPLFMTGFIL